MKNVLVALLLFGSMAFTSNTEASKGSIIVEILERFLKNSDELVEKQKGGVVGGVQGGAPKVIPEAQDEEQALMEETETSPWLDCVMSAQTKKLETRLAALEASETELTRARLGRLLETTSSAYCAERLVCDSKLSEEESYFATDFETCMFEERYGSS